MSDPAEKVSDTLSLSERVRFYGLGTETFFNADDFLILANEVAELERKLAILSIPPSVDERQRAMERDAARYRWLREHAKPRMTLPVTPTDSRTNTREVIVDCGDSDGLDAAIDRALSSAPKAG